MGKLCVGNDVVECKKRPLILTFKRVKPLCTIPTINIPLCLTMTAAGCV
jgi:hypothetical protein